MLVSRSRLLLGEEAEALAELLVLLDRAEVHLAEGLERRRAPRRGARAARERRGRAPRPGRAPRAPPPRASDSSASSSAFRRAFRRDLRGGLLEAAARRRGRAPAPSSSRARRPSDRAPAPRGGRGGARARAARARPAARARAPRRGAAAAPALPPRGRAPRRPDARRRRGPRRPRGAPSPRPRAARRGPARPPRGSARAPRGAPRRPASRARGGRPTRPAPRRAGARPRASAEPLAPSARARCWARRSPASASRRASSRPDEPMRRPTASSSRWRRARSSRPAASRPSLRSSSSRSASASARNAERSSARPSRASPIAFTRSRRALEVLLVVGHGERRGVVAVAQVLELVARRAEGDLGLAARGARRPRPRGRAPRPPRRARAPRARARGSRCRRPRPPRITPSRPSRSPRLVTKRGRDPAAAVEPHRLAEVGDEVHAAEQPARHRLEARAHAHALEERAAEGHEPEGGLLLVGLEHEDAVSRRGAVQRLDRRERALGALHDEPLGALGQHRLHRRLERAVDLEHVAHERADALPARRFAEPGRAGGAPPRPRPRGARGSRAGTRAGRAASRAARRASRRRGLGGARVLAPLGVPVERLAQRAHQAIALGEQVAQPLLEVAALALHAGPPRCPAPRAAPRRCAAGGRSRRGGPRRPRAGPRRAPRGSAPRPGRRSRRRARAPVRAAASAAAAGLGLRLARPPRASAASAASSSAELVRRRAASSSAAGALGEQLLALALPRDVRLGERGALAALVRDPALELLDARAQPGRAPRSCATAARSPSASATRFASKSASRSARRVSAAPAASRAASARRRASATSPRQRAPLVGGEGELEQPLEVPQAPVARGLLGLALDRVRSGGGSRPARRSRAPGSARWPRACAPPPGGAPCTC